MKIEDFKSGTFVKGSGYKYFLPEKINYEWIWENPVINKLLEQASIKLGELNSYARIVPNIDLYLQLYVTKEAVVSSKIEGTQTNMNEAFLKEDDIRPEKKDDWLEVQNYTQALAVAIKKLEKLPISSRLIKETHKILLKGVRGKRKTPGEFRRTQNWIGGATIIDASFIPPSHHHVDELMSDLEKFLHNDEINVPTLIKTAIIHYQFETIHPFLDGNGRIGRLLIPLHLVSLEILDKPLLYLSEFFEKDKSLYYDNLMRVRHKGDLLHWVKYFLIGIKSSAEVSIKTLTQILELKDKNEKLIQSKLGRRAGSGLTLLNSLFKTPIITVKDVELTCSLSPKAANSLVDSFVKSKILEEMTGQKRYRLFLFDKYLDLFD